MPYVGNFYDFLAGIDLQQYHHDFVNKLGVTAIEHVAYVQSDDVLNLGMTAPEWRRLRASMKKVRKGKLTSVKDKIKGSKQKPTIVRVQNKDGAPTGGHIIPSTAIQITDRELGRGEFGKVMQGIWTNDTGQKIQVAVKCLTPEKLAADKGQQDFLKEAAIMHSLNHNHLVKLYGVMLDMDSSLVLVTEFAALRSLCENLKQPALRISFPVNLLLDFTLQIADGMKYLHLSNIIHRDLATRNILLFVDDEGTKQVKISDFGLSRKLMIGENYRSEMRPNLKLPLAWMPVEALTKLTFTKASDVWSFAVTMWEMFSYGCQPWATKSGEEILRAIDRPNLQRLSKPEACPAEVYELILRCWRHEPESRPTFAELCEEIPTMKPIQVRALSNYQANRDEELSYRSEDIITVLDTNDDTGVWRGMTIDGKVGLFHRSNTTIVSGSGGGKLKRWKSGSKSSNKTENRKRFGSPKTPKRSPSKLSASDIGTPSEYKHVFHVGYDGRVQGDPTFGGDYRFLPSQSGSPTKSDQWSSTSSTSSRSETSTPTHRSASTTPSKSPTFPSVSIHSRNHHILSNDPPVTTSSQPELRCGIPVSGPRVRLAEAEKWDLEGSSCSLADNQSVDGAFSSVGATAKTPDDELSSLDFGSLLDDVMTAWDVTRTNVGIDHPESPSESSPKDGANGTASGRSTPSSIDDSHGASLSASSHSQGITVMVGREDGATLESSSPEGSLDSLPPLHNAITKDMPSNPVKTYRRTPSLQSASDYSTTSLQHSLSREGTDSSQDNVSESRFTLLSSVTSESADNEDVEDVSADEAETYLEQPLLNGQASCGFNAAVNGNSHMTYEARADKIVDAGDYADLAVPDELQKQDSMFAAEIESTDVSCRSGVHSQVSKSSIDSDDDDMPVFRDNSQREAVSNSGQEAYERLVGGNVSDTPRSPSLTKSPRRPKGPPPKGPRPKVPPPKGPPPKGTSPRPKGPPPPVPPAPWMKQSSPSTSPKYANHTKKSDSDETQYSVSALRQKFDFSRRGGREEPLSRKESGEGPTGAEFNRSGSHNESISVQMSSGRSNSKSGYDSSEVEPELKLSNRTLKSLERTMPRRTRRSVGESKTKRRSTDDITESDRSSVASSRASEGDSSSDEGASKTITNSYQSTACPLPDLTEDQTNYLSSATHNPSPLPPPRTSSKNPQQQAQTNDSIQSQFPPKLKPRLIRQHNNSSSDTVDDQCLPPVIRAADLLQRRSRSFDVGILNNMHKYPETNPFHQKSHSMDILDTEGSHVTTSPQQIRDLLNINDDKCEMPSRAPPPVPKMLSNRQRFQIEDPNLMTNRSGICGKNRANRVRGYELMKPQQNLNINVPLYPLHEHHTDSDSGHDSPQPEFHYLEQSKLSNDNHWVTDSNPSSYDKLRYMRMGSLSQIQDIDVDVGKLTRSQSAYTIKLSPKLESLPPQQHRWEDFTTVARSKFKHDGQTTTGRRTMNSRMSRSMDDLLSADCELGGLKEAESLSDILARTYVPPSGGSSADQNGIYLVPPSWKNRTPNSSGDAPTTSKSTVTHQSAVSNAVHPSPPQSQLTLGKAVPISPSPSLHGHFVKDPSDLGYIDMRSISVDTKPALPSVSETIQEHEPLALPKTSAGISLQSNRCSRTSSVKEMHIVPSYGKEVHSLPTAGSSNFEAKNEPEVSTRQKSSRYSSKELHVIPNISTQRDSQAKTNSLNQSLSQDVPLPKRKLNVRFNSIQSSGSDSTEGSSTSVEELHGVDARRLKDQLPIQITIKNCLEALRDAQWNENIAKQQLLIRHLAKTMSVEECACESALKQSSWDLTEAADILNDAPELSISL